MKFVKFGEGYVNLENVSVILVSADSKNRGTVTIRTSDSMTPSLSFSGVGEAWEWCYRNLGVREPVKVRDAK